MFRFIQISCAAAGLSVAALFLSLTFIVWKYLPPMLLHADGTLTRTEGVLSKANATLINLDEGTRIWADTSEDDARNVAALVADAHGLMGAMRGAVDSAHQSADALQMELTALNKTTDAATGLTLALTRDAETVNRTIESTQPLIAAYTETGTHLDALIEDPNWRALAFHAASSVDSADGILADFRRAADKATDDYLKPVPWWQWPMKRSGQVIDIGAAIARHAP